MFELAPVSGCREASRTDSRLASVACTLSAPYDENEDKVVDQASNIEHDQLYSLGRNDMICLEIDPHGVSLVISSDMPPLPRIYSIIVMLYCQSFCGLSAVMPTLSSWGPRYDASAATVLV